MAMHVDANDDSIAASEDVAQADERFDDNQRAEELEEERQMLARQESRALKYLRVAVILMLLTAATLVGFGVFYFTRKDETNSFNSQFSGLADRIIDSFATSVERNLGAIDALSVTITSYARGSGAKFPNVTLPDFEIRGCNARVLADTLYFYWTPLVTDEERDGWEAYAAENHGWFEEEFFDDMAQAAMQDAAFGLTANASRRLEDSGLGDYIPFIYGYDNTTAPAPKGSGPYLPYWQNSPVAPLKYLLNFDMLSHPIASASLEAAISSKKAVLDKTAGLEEFNSADSQVINYILTLSQYRHQVTTYQGSPFSPLAYPVFDNFGPNRSVVGTLSTIHYWRLYFEGILPNNADGLVAVMENTRNQTFSYWVSGAGVVDLGPGDHHEQKYNHMEVSVSIADYVAQRSNPSTRAYTTVDLNTEFCAYTLRVYPTQQMEDQYVTNKPMQYTIVVVIIFLFTSLVFVMYDVLVNRRQRIVMNKALASGKIVSSLFPKNVRDRLYQDEAFTGVSRSTTWPSGNSKTFSDYLQNDGGLVVSSEPIADHFAESTVMFADIAGFTSWGSSRTPAQVFLLLETIYGAFDAIAVKRRVFKVETIGDCYVAVTGVPDRQEDHAIIMARFATDLLSKISELAHQLAETLGQDTADLGLRIGLHSGPVTAGVLRGQKSRFQLFGDTVNTASRMESTGVTGRIHASETTANLLSAKGRNRWIVPREEKVVAKGKGELQTYWVEIIALGSSTPSSLENNDLTADEKTSEEAELDD